MSFFKKKTIDEILKIENNEEMVNEVYKYLSKKCHYGEKIDLLDEKEKILYDVMDFEAEINDGGLEQFFYSEASYDVERTCQSLIAFDHQEMADLLHEAIQLFPNAIVPKMQSEREKILELLLNDGPVFQELDDQYSQLDIDLMNDYLKYIKQLYS